MSTPRAHVQQCVGEIPHGSQEAGAQDGRIERVSIAAFAQAVRELILATQRAIADQLEHARLRFDPPFRHAGTVLRPGSLSLRGHGEPFSAAASQRPLANPTIFGTVSDSRAGDPVAIALAMLEEGCINESVAAAEAAVAALQCREPRAKPVLARIAKDETRHAGLAWRTPRWLLDSHPEVAPVPRSRLGQLAPSQPVHPAPLVPPVALVPNVTGSPTRHPELAPMLRQHGRLSGHDRTVIRTRVSGDMIAPLPGQLGHLGHPIEAAGPVVASGPALA
jgi:hypothetical protein